MKAGQCRRLLHGTLGNNSRETTTAIKLREKEGEKREGGGSDGANLRLTSCVMDKEGRKGFWTAAEE